MFHADNLKVIQKDILDAVSDVALKHNITITQNGGSVGDLEAVLKFKLNATNDSGESQEEADFRQYAAMYGMDPEWIDEAIENGGKTYTIKGLLMSRRKNVVSVANGKGKLFVVPAQAVINAMRLKGVSVPEFTPI